MTVMVVARLTIVLYISCRALESLDIRNFDMGKVTNSSYMFLSVGS